MDDARTKYQEAVMAYSRAREGATKLIKMIEAVSSALNYHLPSFLGWQYSVQMQMTRYEDKARFEMSEWPDAAALKTALVGWHEAFVNLQKSWSSMTAAERVGFSSPPKSMETK